MEYGAVMPSDAGFSRFSLTFSVEMDLVAAIRVDGLTLPEAAERMETWSRIIVPELTRLWTAGNL